MITYIFDLSYDLPYKFNYDYNYKLNTNKLYSKFEKSIFEIVLYNLKIKNIIFDNKTHNIEFSLNKNPSDNIDIKYMKEKNNKIYPLLSSYTFLNDSTNYITFLTNFDNEIIKYKDYPKENNFQYLFPEKNKHFIFDSSKYNGIFKINNENNDNDLLYLIIHIWDIDIPNIFLDNNLNYNMHINFKNVSINNCFENIFLNTDFFNNDFFEDIFYKQIKEPFFHFKQIIPNDNISNIYNVFTNVISINIEENPFFKIYSDCIQDIIPFYLNKNIESTNIFYKSYIINNIFDEYMINYINIECKIYKENIINLFLVSHINNYLNIYCQKIMNDLFIKYNLNKNIGFTLKNIYYIKQNFYDKDLFQKYILQNNTLRICHLILLINLNKNRVIDIEIINTKEVYSLNPGDILIYNNNFETFINIDSDKIINNILYIMIDIHINGLYEKIYSDNFIDTLYI
jgi:hypothetical protein